MTDTRLPQVGVARRQFLAGAALAWASLFLALPGRAQTLKRIGVAQPDRTADFYQGFINSVKEEAAKRDYEILESFSGSAPEKQMYELNTWIASGVDALVVMPSDPNAIGSIVRKCKQQGIVFVGYANIVQGADGYMKWDDPQAGTAMGGLIVKHMKERLGGKGEIGLLTLPTNQATRERITFTRDAITKELPEVTFSEVQAVLAPEALKATQSLLQAHPEMKVIVCCADDGALGARSAYQNSGLPPDNVFLCGFDGSKQNLNLIKRKDPFIQASAALDIIDVGRKVVDIPDNIIRKSGPNKIIMPYVMVTPETDATTIDGLLKVYG